MTMSAEDIKQKINTMPMTSLQITVVFLCCVIHAFDGFDVLVISFTAPTISAAWGISPEQLGIVFGSGLAGIMAGSFLLAPAADYIGRRKAILLFLSVISLGLFLTAYSTQISELVVTRFLTGLALGGLLASLITMVAEYSSEKRRDLTINIYLLGYNCGIAAGGIASLYLINQFGWQSVYIAGAIASIVLAITTFSLMPESIDFLLLNHPKNALEKLNKILVKMGHAELDKLPPKLQRSVKSKVSVRILFSSNNIRPTLALWSCFFIATMTAYFLLTWLPSILTTAGLKNSSGISASLFFSMGGAAGMLTLGYFSASLGLLRLIKVFFVLCSLSILMLAAAGTSLTAILVASTAIGFFVTGAVGGLYVFTARLYPPEARTTGVGWAIGIGRFGAILGPIIAGYLYTMNWTNVAVYCVFAIPSVFAIIPLFWMKFPQNADKG